MMDLTKIEYKALDTSWIDKMLEIQEEAFACMQDKSLLRKNTFDTLKICFDKPSYVLGAFFEDIIIAFGILLCPGNGPECLARGLLPDSQLDKAANMKLIIVRPQYRGNGIQAALLALLEQYAKTIGITLLCATVSPANKHSIQNVENASYKLLETVTKYGGMQRRLYVKSL